MFLAIIVLPSPLRHEHEILRATEEVQTEEALDERSIDRLGPVPPEIGDRFEAAEARAFETSFEVAASAVLEFGGGQVFEHHHDRRPPIFCGPRQHIIEIVGDAREAEASQLITQDRGRGRGRG